MVSISKRNFSRGIFSPVVQARRDVDAWAAGARRLQNVTILKHGGVTKRMGTEFVYKLPDNDKDVRLLPFTFATGESYALLMGNGTMKPIARGGMVLSAGFGITDITQADPGVVTAPFHNLDGGSEVFLNGIAGMIELNGRVVTVKVIDANRFSIGIDTRAFTAFSGDDGLVRSAPPPVAPPPPVVQPPTTSPPPPVVTPPSEYLYDRFGNR